MSDKKYVKPPTNKSENIFSKIKEIYRYLHPDYWKRKLPHLLIVISINFLLYLALCSSLFGIIFQVSEFSFIGSILVLLISTILTTISTVFYPFSLYWYKGSFIGQLLNSIYHIGGFFTVILKIIATLLGGIVIAGFLSPIYGVLTWKKCVKKNIVIGEEKDFR